jgi:predicted phage terminase large subunit-like protein
MHSQDRTQVLHQLSTQPLPPERARQSLYEFVKQAWHFIEPDTPFKDGWHIRVVCAHLEAIVLGDIPSIVINVPPGTMKSILSSVCLCPWAWLTNPSMRFLHASYSQSLALRDSVKARNIIRSDWYQATASALGVSVELTRGQDQKSRFDTTASGWRFATSVGGSATGEHPDVICIDDVHSAAQAQSDKERQAAIDWWDGTMTTRGRSRGCRRAIVGQRLHEQDLPGHLIGQGWTKLVLPMRYEQEQHAQTPLGDCDIRSEEGELLCPSLFSAEAVDSLEKELGTHRAAGQLQQRPTALDGEIFRREWFGRTIKHAPSDGRFVRYCDKAGTPGSGAYTAMVLMCEKDGTYYICDVVRGQWSPNDRNAVIRQVAAADSAAYRDYMFGHEREPGSAGVESSQITSRELAGIRVKEDRVTGDKVSRSLNFAAQCEAGNVVLVEGEWNHELISELLGFPNAQYKDQVDACSGGFGLLVTEQSTVANQLMLDDVTLEIPPLDWVEYD